MQTPEPGIYKHYKGKLYEVIGTATHSESSEQLVVYKALYQPEGQNFWVRPWSMFMEKIEIDGRWIQRFEKVD